MATPVKVSASAVIPSVLECIACSKENKQKYFVVKRNGEKGPAYLDATGFYDVDFWSSDNFGAFLCLKCHRDIKRILDMKKNMLMLAEKVLATSQHLTFQSNSKRVIERTPNEDTKRCSRSIDTDELRAKTCLTFSGSDTVTVPDMCDLVPSSPTVGQAPTPDAAHCSPLTSLESLEREDSYIDGQHQVQRQSSRTDKLRTEVTTYGSLKLRTIVGPIVKSLSNGSYRKAVRLMLSSDNEQMKKESVKGIKDKIKLECDTFVKVNRTALRKTSEEDLSSFKLSEVKEPMKKMILWEVLCSAASKGRTRSNDEVKLSTAALILLNARSKFLCRFQYVVSVAMYNNQLQREGYNILSRLGLTVSHSALHKCLSKAQATVDRKMADLKHGIENNKVIKTTSGIVEEHSYAAMTGSEDVTPDHTYDQQVTQLTDKSFQPGYRFNIDNLDFMLKVRDMTEGHQNKSKHYVQAMAVVDRVPCEHLPDDHQLADLMTVPIQSFLPSEDDNSRLRGDFIHMIALILTEHVPAFKVFEGVYTPFFEHKYSENMDKKSTVLPLGILDKSENKTNEMIDILEYLHKYIPNARGAADIETVDIREEQAHFRAIPLGGDQLTCERIRGAHIVRLDGDTPEERLEGCMAMIEDFHEKMNFLQVIMDKYYKAGSAREAGTLYQLRNVINRRNVSSNVAHNYHNASAFIDLVGDGHIIAAALDFFGMESLDSYCARIPRATAQEDKVHQKRILTHMLGELVDEIIMNDMTKSIEAVEQNIDAAEEENPDRVNSYASNLLKFCLLRRVNVTATRSGDGDRVIRHWKYAMLLYDSAHKTKYRLESFLFLAAVLALYTPRHSEQVVRNRFISLSGGKGKNLDGDYVMELMNKYAKSRVKLVGPTHSPELIMRIGKTMMFCHDVQVQLERQVKADFLSRDHTSQNVHDDLLKVVGELQKAEVFKRIPGRSHPSFEDEPVDIFSNIDGAGFHDWFDSKKHEYSNNKLAF